MPSNMAADDDGRWRNWRPTRPPCGEVGAGVCLVGGQGHSGRGTVVPERRSVIDDLEGAARARLVGIRGHNPFGNGQMELMTIPHQAQAPGGGRRRSRSRAHSMEAPGKRRASNACANPAWRRRCNNWTPCAARMSVTENIGFPHLRTQRAAGPRSGFSGREMKAPRRGPCRGVTGSKTQTRSKRPCPSPYSGGKSCRRAVLGAGTERRTWTCLVISNPCWCTGSDFKTAARRSAPRIMAAAQQGGCGAAGCPRISTRSWNCLTGGSVQVRRGRIA